MAKANKGTLVNFGVSGWVTIIYCLLMFYFYVGMCNDGSNATVPAIAALLGAEEGTLYNLNSAGGLLGIILFLIAGQVNKKIGARLTSGICCIIAGCAYMMLGNSTSLVMYCAAYTFTIGGIMSAGYIAGGTLVATWFPKRKGIVMGYTTMGHNLASATYVAIMTVLMASNAGGITFAVMPMGIGCIIVGIIGLIFIRNTPKERGQNPDNVSDEVYESEYFHAAGETVSEWTTAKLLKCKELWVAAVCTGGFQICSVGIMSTLVLRNTGDLGFDITTALTIMTICALFGLLGSWGIGVIDDRIGTRKTMMGFGVWYAVALLCNASEVMPLVYLSIFMIGMGIGGSANFTTSLPTSIFGRHEFPKVNGVIFPIQGALTALCFAINGMVLLATGGSYRYAYVIFAVIAILMAILVSTIDDKKYNRDYLEAGEGQEA